MTRSASEIAFAFEESKKIDGVNRLHELRKLFQDAHELEQRMARDLAYPLLEIRKLQGIIPDLQSDLKRFENLSKKWRWEP